MSQNDTTHEKVKGTLYICHNYPRLPNFTPFYSTANYFQVTGHFEITALNDPKMALKTKRSKVSHIHFRTTPSPNNFTPFHSMASRFRVIGHFERSTSDDSKMTLNTKRSKVPHIYILQHFLHGQSFLSARPF